MRINLSALKHGVAEADILHAAERRAFESEPDDDMPAKQFILGLDSHGRILELVVSDIRQWKPAHHPRHEGSKVGPEATRLGRV